MKVAVVEAQDFASGTSSRSSKLIHGGIRYLENLEFGLVFEALRERRYLFEMAPHLVHPLRFMLPVYRGGRVGMFKLGLGMWLYDALSMFEAPQMHERLSKAETLSRAPMLEANALVGSYVYSDAYMDDHRLVVETMRSAHRLGAVIVNYVKAEQSQLHDGKVVAVKCRDQFSGREVLVRAKHFVSTVGPWTDQLASGLLESWKPILRPTKGIHLTVAKSRLDLKQAVVMMSDDEKRIVFGIPRREMVIVGTTDTDFNGDPATVQSDRSDVEYLLRIVNDYFPGAELRETDIIASYSGVRPLVHDGSADESRTSREHTIIADPRNITFLAGGKYTTYRAMAEQTIDACLENFEFSDRMRWAKSDTKNALNPLATEFGIRRMLVQATHFAREFNVPVETVTRLIERHGEEAAIILQNYMPRLRLSDALLWELEAFHAVHETQCMTLKDFFLQRAHLFLAEPDHGRRFLPQIAAVFAAEMGWSPQQTQTQVQALADHERHEMAWQK
jgi:glycerol-3-phosphate dehydrogenase